MATDFVRRLPYKLQSRFESLGRFVRSVIEELEFENRTDKSTRIDRGKVQDIEVVVFAITLESFFRAGTQVASSAVQAFDTLDMRGFVVGTTVFEGENENVLRGSVLASDLRSRLEESIGPSTHLLRFEMGLRQLIRTLWEEARDGKGVD